MASSGLRFLTTHGGSTALIIFVHGMDGSPRDLEDLRRFAARLMPDADHYCPKLPLGWFSMHSALSVCEAIRRDIDSLPGIDGYGEIILVGHSCGALLVRSVYVLAHGMQPGTERDPARASPWAMKVTRIVLLAALARGWQSTVALGPGMRVIYWSTIVWELLFLPRLLAFDHRRGAPFLTMVRLQSLALQRLAIHQPTIVQVLGTIDDLVSPADNVDLVTGDKFFYLEAPATGHFNIIVPDTQKRSEVLALALTGDTDRLRTEGLSAAQVADLYSDAADDFDMDDRPTDRRQQERPVDHAVMVVHGIRDYGFWTKKLAGRIKQHAAESDLRCRTVTSSYGFLPMGPFLFKALRARRVEWFMDQFVQAKAMYPKATFGFVGHSNGTYLLAGAMSACPAIRFDRVVFAGSVVRTNFNWAALAAKGQVKSVVNYVATNDLVVAAFPKPLALFRVFDLGGAGVDGFRTEDGSDRSNVVQNVRYIEGGHGAAIVEENWDDIAGFVLHGADPVENLNPEIGRSRRNSVWGLAASWGGIAGALVVAVVVGAVIFCGTDLVLSGPAHLIVASLLSASILRAIMTKF